MVTKDRTISDVTEALSSELRRGLSVLAVLATCHVPQYGYSLKQNLHASGLDINEGTLYPLLRRMEDQGLLQSEWQVTDEERPRRYYRLTATGQDVLRALRTEWSSLTNAVSGLLDQSVSTTES